jgi:hypothetical protein
MNRDWVWRWWPRRRLHAYISNLHFEESYCLLITRCGGARQQRAERFVICLAVSFADLINLSQYQLASSLVHYGFPSRKNHFFAGRRLAARDFVKSMSRVAICQMLPQACLAPARDDRPKAYRPPAG